MKPLDLNTVKNLAIGAFVAFTAVGSMSSYIKETGIEEFELLRNGSPAAIVAEAPSDPVNYAHAAAISDTADAFSNSDEETSNYRSADEDLSVYRSADEDPADYRSLKEDGEHDGSDRPGLIDLNSADSRTLQTLSGIGPVKAEAIIEYRKAYGGFVCAEEVLQVKGIGKATYEKIKDRIYVKTRDRQNQRTGPQIQEGGP